MQHAVGRGQDAAGDARHSTFDAAASMYGWKYRHWIEALQKSGGHFITAADILDGRISRSACNLLLRHDIDQCELYANVWPLLAIEHRFGIRSSTYLFAEKDSLNWSSRRRGSPWFRKEWKLKDVEQVLRYQDEGFEFGLHADAVGRCRRQGNTVDADEALAILDRDVATLRSQGIHLRTMAAHGFAWADRQRSWYDNYAAEFDFTTRDSSVQSQFHVLERFAELGRPASARLGMNRMKRMQSIWLPRHVPFGWLHARSEQTHLRADALTVTDAAGTWKYIGIRELTSLVPQLPGCLIVLNVHPIYYAYGDDGLEFIPRSTQLDDHRRLDDLYDQRSAVSIQACARSKPAVRYSRGLDFDRVGPEWVSDRLGREALKGLDRQLRRVNSRFKGGAWFEHLINSPNAEIIAWLDESVDPKDRERLRVVELCGGVGPVAVGLTRHGFRPENIAVTDVDPKHLAMARAFSQAVTQGKIRVFPLDVCNIECRERFDIAVISSWENSILPYDRVTAQCRNVVAEGGLLVMTFLEKSRIVSEGYDCFPDRLLQQKIYYAITVEELMEIFDRNGFEPICYLDHGYPKLRFPRHVLVGRKRPSCEKPGEKGSGVAFHVGGRGVPSPQDGVASPEAAQYGSPGQSPGNAGRKKEPSPESATYGTPWRLLCRRFRAIGVGISSLPRGGAWAILFRPFGDGHSRVSPSVSANPPEGRDAASGDALFARLQDASQRYFGKLRRVLSEQHELPSWSFMLNIGPLAAGKSIEALPPGERVRLLSLCVRKATCHPFGPWNLDYSQSGFDRPAILAGLLVGYGNKCGAVAGLTRGLLEAHGIACRTIACAGQMPSGESVQHCLNEVLLDGRWRLVDNDIFQYCDSFLTATDGSIMTRDEVLAMELEELVRRYPWPYTYRGFDYDSNWVQRNWAAWYYAVAGTVRDLG